ncbi:hypothetical protein EVAR_10783_1 [Eumeta japonica]|uniref:Uncharacterized protein n=1 Tax=Eumeta variegata TaxID=151549 RepID=A0A4C1W9J8_EUMVA|nr:hypothetical protein EVAR_10783_1 [Eumeta japonica]
MQSFNSSTFLSNRDSDLVSVLDFDTDPALNPDVSLHRLTVWPVCVITASEPYNGHALGQFFLKSPSRHTDRRHNDQSDPYTLPAGNTLTGRTTNGAAAGPVPREPPVCVLFAFYKGLVKPGGRRADGAERPRARRRRRSVSVRGINGEEKKEALYLCSTSIKNARKKHTLFARSMLRLSITAVFIERPGAEKTRGPPAGELTYRRRAGLGSFQADSTNTAARTARPQLQLSPQTLCDGTFEGESSHCSSLGEYFFLFANALVTRPGLRVSMGDTDHLVISGELTTTAESLGRVLNGAPLAAGSIGPARLSDLM